MYTSIFHVLPNAQAICDDWARHRPPRLTMQQRQRLVAAMLLPGRCIRRIPCVYASETPSIHFYTVLRGHKCRHRVVEVGESRCPRVGFTPRIFYGLNAQKISTSSSCSIGALNPCDNSSARGSMPKRPGSEDGLKSSFDIRSRTSKYATRWCVRPLTVTLMVLLHMPEAEYVPATAG